MKYEIDGRVNAPKLREAVAFMHGGIVEDTIIEITGARRDDMLVNHLTTVGGMPVLTFQLDQFNGDPVPGDIIDPAFPILGPEPEMRNFVNIQQKPSIFIFDGLGNYTGERLAAFKRVVDHAQSKGHKVVTITYEDYA